MNLGAQTRIPEKFQKALTSCKAQCAWFRRFRMMGLGILRLLRSRQKQLLKCITPKKNAATDSAREQHPGYSQHTNAHKHLRYCVSKHRIGILWPHSHCLEFWGRLQPRVSPNVWSTNVGIQDCVNPYPISPFDITTVKLCKTSCMFINHIM